MKKLIIALAALTAVLATNAAVVDWKYEINGAAGGSATEYVGYNVYLVEKAYYDALTKVTAESITDHALQSATVAWESSSGRGSSKKNVFSTPAKAYSVGDTTGTTYDYYLVLVDAAGENYNTASYSYTARDESASYTDDDITHSVASSSLAMTKFAPSSDVPEPTSGLLVLLGVAGLALRRRA